MPTLYTGNNYRATNNTGTGDVWLDWNNAYTTTQTLTSYTTVRTWQVWNETSSAQTTYYTNRTWDSWNQGVSTVRPSGFYTYTDLRTPEQIAAEQAAYAEQREVRRVAAEVRRVEMAEAAERADKLLTDHLTPEQLKEWREKQQIHVRSQRGRRYCIKKGRAHNVFEVDAKGRRLRELCGHVSDSVPNEDNVLAQKLALELMEDDFLKTCNIWDLTLPNRPVVSRSGQLLRV